MRAVALTYLSLSSFILGHVEQADSLSAQALTWSRNLRHPHNLAFALSYAALLKALGEPDPAATELLDELTALTTEHHFPAYMAVANVLRGHLLSVRGQTAEGLVLIRKGLSAGASAGASWNQSYFLGLLALSCENAGLADEALDVLTKALEHADHTDERWFEAELHRLKGEWLVAHRPDRQDEAETCFRRAIEIAQKQQARLWELRAATSLAQLWLAGRRPKEARDLLAPVHAWFREGRDTPDLKRANALLDKTLLDAPAE
jgi:predicted ATPase